MPKYVLSESAFEFTLEPRANYYAYIQDHRKKMFFKKADFKSADEVVRYADRYLNIAPENIERPKY